MFIFVSDVHLTEPHSKRYGAFLHLLDRVLSDNEVEALFLVGDIFDLWLGDRKVFIDRHPEVLKKITEIAKIKKIHYFEGNHDFQLGKMWKKMGVLVYPAEHSFQLNGKNVLVSHGDLLDKEDKSYLRLRWFLRTPLAVMLIKTLPHFILTKVGEALSTTEQKEASTPKLRKSFLLNWKKWTEELYQRTPYDIFICGHHHFRLITPVLADKAEAVNLGSWLEEDLKVLEFGESLDFVKI